MDYDIFQLETAKFCDVRYKFSIKTMFSLSLLPVVCRSAHVLFMLCVCLHIVVSTHIVLYFCFVCLRLVYPMLPVSLDCPFLIAPPVFSIYFKEICTLKI